MFLDNKKYTCFLVDSLAASFWFCVLPSSLIPFALLPISVTRVSASTWHWQQGCVSNLNHGVKGRLLLKRTQRQTVGPEGAAVQPVSLQDEWEVLWLQCMGHHCPARVMLRLELTLPTLPAGPPSWFCGLALCGRRKMQQ